MEEQKATRQLKVAMTLLVRNEEDIIEDNILYHSSIGVDKFFIMDNLSTDDTRQIIERLSSRISISYFYQPNDEYRQSEWVTSLARQAASDPECFDWVIHNDADEFWCFGNQSLSEYLSNIPEATSKIILRRFNAVNLINDASEKLIKCTSHPRQSEYFYRKSLNCLGGALPGKCMHRASADVLISQGNHSASNLKGETVVCETAFILHYPYRTWDQYRQKIRLGGAAYKRNRDLPEAIGATWRQHYEALESIELINFWKSLHQNISQVRRGLDDKSYIHCDIVSRKLQQVYADLEQSKTRAAVHHLLRQSKDYCRDKRNLIIGPFRNSDKRGTLGHHNLAFSLSGINSQLKGLKFLEQNVLEGTGLNDKLYNLRDIFSLFPENPHFYSFLAKLFDAYCPKACQYLRKACHNKIILLHISCQKRLTSSIRSSETFKPLGSKFTRLIMIGDCEHHEPDTNRIFIENDDCICKLPASDDYEFLGTKVFYALLVLHLIGKPKLVIKLDDDLQLSNASEFQQFLDSVIEANHSYVGWKVGASHRNQWHGWHIGKCHDPSLEAKGFQYPLVSSYAAGGFGYILDHEMLADCVYMYMAMRSFFGQHIIQLEDVYIGHAAQMSGKSLFPIQRERPVSIKSAALPGLCRVNLNSNSKVDG